MSVESMEYDVIVVGGGPAGLAAAIRLKQMAASDGRDISICLLEKGSEIGAHVLSGAVIETRALDELMPDWLKRSPHTGIPVAEDEFHLLTGPATSVHLPGWLVPSSMDNAGCRIVSLGRICRWLGEEAEALGVDVFAGFAAGMPLVDANGAVAGIVTNDIGRSRNSEPKVDFEPGIEIHARYTIVAEGARGHIARRLIRQFSLDETCDPQHYGLGLKELWQIDAAAYAPGRVVHGAGWPLGRNAGGGFFAYHAHDSLLALGLIVDLNYSNPWLDPFLELQRLKHHPLLGATLAGATRVGYGARAIAKGGLNSLPRLAMPGALLVGCAAGMLNVAKNKGTHTAMKSGLIAAESTYRAIAAGRGNDRLDDFEDKFAASWAGKELHRARNFGPALHRFGLTAGGAFNLIDQTLCGGKLPISVRDTMPDHEALRAAADSKRLDYPRPDGILSFDRMSSVYLSGTNHDEDQPCHLLIADTERPVKKNLAIFNGPEQRYCPAGVYAFPDDGGTAKLRVNAQNCLHCKACDIKDPGQNITWVPPESGGPVYSEM